MPPDPLKKEGYVVSNYKDRRQKRANIGTGHCSPGAKKTPELSPGEADRVTLVICLQQETERAGSPRWVGDRVGLSFLRTFLGNVGRRVLCQEIYKGVSESGGRMAVF